MYDEVDSVIAFFYKYRKFYDKNVLTKLKNENYNMDMFDPDCLAFMSSKLKQIYHATGCLPSAYDPYLVVFNKLIELFDIKCNILEVASGHYPALGYDIARKQIQLGGGTITFMDPNLICNEKNKLYPNITLAKKAFDLKTDISDYDIVIAYHPHEATKDLIESVVKNNKKFLIFPCSCYDVQISKLLIKSVGYEKTPTYEYCKQLSALNHIAMPLLGEECVHQVYGNCYYKYFYKK